MNTTSLLEQLRTGKATLAVRVVDEMFRDPFWTERFAARGRRHSEEDLAFHVDYLVEALSARDAAVMERYARWLQGVLTSRGMCTLHLAESFRVLGSVVRETYLEGGDALPYLEAARLALRYAGGAARELQNGAERIVAQLPSPRPEHAPYLVSYAADALALDRPEVFDAYVKWLGTSLDRRGPGRAQLALTLDALGRIVGDDASFSPSLHTAFGALVSRGAA